MGDYLMPIAQATDTGFVCLILSVHWANPACWRCMTTSAPIALVVASVALRDRGWIVTAMSPPGRNSCRKALRQSTGSCQTDFALWSGSGRHEEDLMQPGEHNASKSTPPEGPVPVASP
jgi:hypothetical protein